MRQRYLEPGADKELDEIREYIKTTKKFIEKAQDAEIRVKRELATYLNSR